MSALSRPSKPPILSDTRLNVAQLLKEPVGAQRRFLLAIARLPLGEDRTARQIEGSIKLTRIGRGVLVTGAADTTVALTCVRCLEEYDQPISLVLEDEFRPSIDVTSGAGLAYAPPNGGSDDDFFVIGEDHEIDLGDSLRQAVWLAAPMIPRCREDCPGIPVAADGPLAEPADAAAAAPSGGDARLAVLQDLLNDTRRDEARPRAGD